MKSASRQPGPGPSSATPPANIRLVWQIACVVALGAAALWAIRLGMEFDTNEQRKHSGYSTVWALHACSFLGLTALIGVYRMVATQLGRRHVLIGLAVALFSFALSHLAPRTTRIFYDEHIYMQIGQTIAHTGKAEYAQYARAEYGEFEVFDSVVNKQPTGHPYLLSWLYRLAGASETASALLMQLLIAGSAALLYYALVLTPFNLPAFAPLIASLAFAATPLVLWWSRTVAVEPSTVAATVASFSAACIHVRMRDPATGEGIPWTGTLLAATAAFAAYFRPESLLVYPMIAAVLWAADRRFVEDRSTWAALALSFALLLPGLMHLWSVRTEDWGATDGRRFDLAFINENLAANAGYFWRQEWFPLSGGLLALAGLGWLAARQPKFGVAILLWLGMSWGTFVLFYAGGYHYGASSRYALISAAPVALLIGIGMAALLSGLRRWSTIRLGLVILVGLNWITALKFVPHPKRESNQSRADVAFVQEQSRDLPPGALVIAMNPCLWLLEKQSAAHYNSIIGSIDGGLRGLTHQFPGGIYVHWDYWLNAQPEFAEIWQDLLNDTRAELIIRTRAAECEFALFRIDTPHAIEQFGGPAPGGKEWTRLDDVIGRIQSIESSDEVIEIP